MIPWFWPDAAAVSRLFEHEVACVPLDVEALPAARVLWLNRQVAVRDPSFARLGSDLARYEGHLLQQCAFQRCSTDATARGLSRARAYADRYGGVGIGLNGGSGRAAFLNGYHVKGLGRTPLVSLHTDLSHASGGAYLEESVRDVIFTEIVRAEFPYSAVPILALIDTGEHRVFHFPDRTDVERRVLVVRPPFVRPAHYLRSSFVCEDPRDGARDARRVEWLFEATAALYGADTLARAYEALFKRWAHQLAYGYVHRLSHASSTVSNVCMDGRLLDFGAMSALPSWADAAVMMGRQPFAGHVRLLPRLIRSSAYFFGRHLDASLGSPARVEALCAAVEQEFRRAVVFETARMLGLDRDRAGSVSHGAELALWWRSLVQLVAHFERERIDMVERTPSQRLAWDVASVWRPQPPEHLRTLHSLLEAAVPPDEREACAQRCHAISRTRPALYRQEAKAAIFEALDRTSEGKTPDRQRIEAFIDQWVATNRRDTACELGQALPVGFAVSGGHSFVLCRDPGDGSLLAFDEYSGGSSAQPHRVAESTPTRVRFADGARPDFTGAVSLHRQTEWA
ncbi:MAG: hypothetical protein AB1430_05865 [Pseudomonadota bacterium]